MRQLHAHGHYHLNSSTTPAHHSRVLINRHPTWTISTSSYSASRTSRSVSVRFTDNSHDIPSFARYSSDAYPDSRYLQSHAQLTRDVCLLQSDAVKKMAVFKLQSSIGDPSFAEVFISYGGLDKLRDLSLNSNGNTLAYALTSFSRLLELDKGWDYVSPELITRVSTLPLLHTGLRHGRHRVRGRADRREHL